MMKKTSTIVTFLVSGLLYSMVTLAAGLPDYYPPSFRTWGVLDRIDIEGGVAVINDTQMTLSDNIHVYTQSSRFSSIHSLSTGMKVGIAMSASSNNTPLVTDIWVLPDDYSQSLH